MPFSRHLGLTPKKEYVKVRAIFGRPHLQSPLTPIKFPIPCCPARRASAMPTPKTDGATGAGFAMAVTVARLPGSLLEKCFDKAPAPNALLPASDATKVRSCRMGSERRPSCGGHVDGHLPAPPATAKCRDLGFFPSGRSTLFPEDSRTYFNIWPVPV